MEKRLKVYVSLLDEGTATLREAYAAPRADGLYELIAPDNYDPEDEFWELAPGALVRLQETKLYDGSLGLVAHHSDPNAIHVFVESSEQSAPPIRETYALPVGENHYKLLATPHYTEAQLWKFPPGSIVRIERMKTAMKGWKPWIAVERVG